MLRRCWAVIASCIFLLCNITQAIANDDIFNVTEFYKQSDASQRFSFKISGGNEPSPAIILRSSINSRPIRLMMIFADDVCVTSFTPGGGENLTFTCRSGADMRASISCRSSCYMQARHSKKGSWKFDYKYKINQNHSLEEVMVFAGYAETDNQTQAVVDDRAFKITEFYKTIDASQRMSLKMTGSEEPVPVVLLLRDAAPAQLMQIFDDDVCVTAVDPDGSFIAYFTCRSGADMRVSFVCRNSCYMQGEHSQKGRWKDVYKYSINQNLSLEEVLAFAGYSVSTVDQESSTNSDIQKTQPEPDNISKMDELKSLCAELGFKAGTEDYGKCVLKMMDN